MKDIVQDRLNKMEDLQQRRILKNLMTGIFLNLVEYQERMIGELERRVFEEAGSMEDRHDVFVTMCHRDEFDPIHEYLYPMLQEDVDLKTVDMRSLASSLNDGEEVRLFRLFLELETGRIHELIRSGTVFQGSISTNAGKYPIRVTLKQNTDYVREIERLYHIFQKNGLPWRTLNHPYAYKFVDVMLSGWGGKQPNEEEEITEISIDLEQYERYQRPDLIPLWNVEKLALKNSGFPVPAVDRVNYEHVLSLRNTGTQHGYLVDGDEENIRYIKRTEDELTVVSPQEKSGVWSIWKITRPVAVQLSKPVYRVVSNRRADSFTGRYALNKGQIIRAQGEIVRMIHAFDAAQFMELAGTEIVARKYPLQTIQEPSAACTYPLNTFISDNIRTERDKPVMRLRFRVTGQHEEADRFILEDLMSFLVSEVQMVFPEYACEGEWA